MKRIELDNFILTGLKLTEADYPLEDERLGNTELDEEEAEYDAYPMDIDWGYVHGQF